MADNGDHHLLNMGIAFFPAFTRFLSRRYVHIVFFLFVLLGFSYLVENLYSSYINNDWEEFSDARTSFYLTAAAESFIKIQNNTKRIAEEIAAEPRVRQVSGSSVGNRIPLFEILTKESARHNVGIEIYDSNLQMLAWEGQSGRRFRTEVAHALGGTAVSYVHRSPVFSQLIVAVPIVFSNAVVGAVVVRRAIEVNYSIENKFISSEGLGEHLTNSLSVPVSFDFSDNASPAERDMVASAILYGLDSSKVGVINIERPILSGYLETISSIYHRLRSILLALCLSLVCVAAIRSSLLGSSLLLKSILITTILWMSRYVLLWIDFPSVLFYSGAFNPLYFASQFGAGIVKSIGEMTITSLILGMNIGFVTSLILKESRNRNPWWHPVNVPGKLLGGIAAASFLFLLLRGYAAVIRSAVFDSTLNFTDARVIVPSPELALMALNLFVLSFCLLVVAAGITSFLLSLFPSKKRTDGIEWKRWLLGTILLLLVSTLFGMLYPNPLTTDAYRFIFTLGVVLLTMRLHVSIRKSSPVATVNNFLLTLLLSGIFFYPLLAANVMRKDRDRIMIFASDQLKPVDSWMNYIVDEALRGFAQGNAANILQYGSVDEIERLAFSEWAQSSISKGGYPCRFQVLSPGGQVLSQFKLGEEGGVEDYLRSLPAVHDHTYRFEQANSIDRSEKVYGGTVPIMVEGDSVLAIARVVLIGTKKSNIRENPFFLQDYSKEAPESFYRRVIVSEYHDGILVKTAKNPLPVSFRLRQSLIDSLQYRSFVWAEEDIDGRAYEVLYAAGSGGRVVSLTVEKIVLTGQLYNIVKMLVYYAIITSLLLVVLYVIRWVRGNRYVFMFRDKLLVAFLLTALAPVVIIGMYGRNYAEEEFLRSISESLEKETATVGKRLMEELRAGGSLAPYLNIVEAEELPQVQFPGDFNLFVDATLAVTSRPELYKAGMLDTRLGGKAFENVILMNKRFYLQTEQIGSVQYAVGYRPLLGAKGKVLGVVSVPSLYQLDEIEKTVAARNALLFGVLAFVFLSIAIIATVLANRIASPIHRLTMATKRVAQGDLDVVVKGGSGEGEVGELIRSFDMMTRELKHSRENLVRYERELAWKEMAKQVAHEIKNPLTPMKLSLQHLRQIVHDRASDFDRVFDDVMKTLLQQIDELSRIASEFSHFARMPKRTENLCDVNEILLSASGLFEQDQRLTFHLALDEKCQPILADENELRRAFINIIRNASQAINESGDITIVTKAVREGIRVTIQDTGMGISEEVRGKLFEPNFSTKTDGMGLGLAIVKKTVGDIGGSISIESTPGTGTTVIIDVPTVLRDENA